MSNLHEALLSQKLPNCQFVTAVYAVVDATRLEVRVARAGHPYPLHIMGDGTIREVRSTGGLLGVADIPDEFDEQRVQLNPGDKLILYTDGLEEVFGTSGKNRAEAAEFTNELRQWAALEVGDFMRALGEHLDCLEGSLHPADDLTAIALEVAS
jgi:serine phosphatase RsbU (regulator of sigma subunit)